MPSRLLPRSSPARGFALLVVLACAAPGSARAENPLVDVQTFRPSPHAYDLFSTLTTDLPEAWSWAAALWASYGSNPLRFVDASGALPDHEAIQTQVSLHAVGSLTLTDWLSLGVEVPVFLVNDGQDAGFIPLDPIPGSALGDVRLSSKLGLVRRAPGDDGLGLGLHLELGLPTGDASAFVSDGWTFVPSVLLDLRVGPFVLAGNLGARLRETARLPFQTEVGHEFVFRVGAKVEIVEGVDLMAETFGSSHNFAEKNNTYVEGLVGGSLRVGETGFRLTLGGGRGFTEGYGSTEMRFVGQLGWEPPIIRDKDHDGILDEADACPIDPEDKDGFEDQDGCPERDNDKDGIADASDQCPLVPEDFDGHEDEEGCPDGDNDGDTIADANDGPSGACANDPEDKDGYKDEDGCPDPDNDGDGFDDKSDGPIVAGDATGLGSCRDDAEDKDGFQDEDGCLDPDNDLDGILDIDDNCPRDATNKCGVVFNPCEIVITETVYFQYDKAVIKPESFAILDAVAALMASRDVVKKIEVQGHTDNDGDAVYNRELSQRRAESVVTYMVEHGVPADRLTAKGYGEDQPIVPNKGAAARAKNRRVQFIILEPSQAECVKP